MIFRPLVVALACAALAIAPRRREPPPCPEGFTRDDGRRARILEALAGDLEGGRALRTIGEPPDMCFGDLDTPGLVYGRAMLLRRDLADTDAAARASHLALHLGPGAIEEGPPRGSGACEVWLGRVAEEERTARAVERRMRGAREAEGETFDVAMQGYAARCRDRVE